MSDTSFPEEIPLPHSHLRKAQTTKPKFNRLPRAIFIRRSCAAPFAIVDDFVKKVNQKIIDFHAKQGYNKNRDSTARRGHPLQRTTGNIA